MKWLRYAGDPETLISMPRSTQMVRSLSCGIGIALGLVWAGFASVASAHSVEVTVEPISVAGLTGAVPVRVLVAVPAEVSRVKRGEWVEGAAAGARLPVQLTAPGLVSESRIAELPALTDGQVWREAHFLLDAAELQGRWTGKFTIAASGDGAKADEPGFAWTEKADRWIELSDRGRPVWRYMFEPLDESTPERRAETYKVYHHVYDPTGQRLVTKGPGGLYPHHRGLFYGFNKISYNGREADVWHCHHGEKQAHRTVVASEAGPILGRHLVNVGWYGQDGAPFAEELRELTAYHVDGGLLLEFASKLTPLVPEVKLAGDPQHAGFQFRASQEVPDKTAKLTYYVRPDGVGKPGEFRNWPENPDHVDLPWLALSFVLGDQRYTCCYLDSPQNPKPARYSERDYGRFGSYFEYTLTKEKPLLVNYRVWLQEGELQPQQVAARREAFVAGPVVKVE
ncbi:MAG: DUF6807 family protein [Pirellulales bacterium]